MSAVPTLSAQVTHLLSLAHEPLFARHSADGGVARHSGALPRSSGMRWRVHLRGRSCAWTRGAALVGAKTLAGACGILLYLKGVHKTLALLTAFYAVGAVGPWLFVLTLLGL